MIWLWQKNPTFTLHRTCPPTRRRFMGLAVASTASALRHAFVASWRHWRAIHAASKCSTSWAPAVRIWWSKDSDKAPFRNKHTDFLAWGCYMGGFAKNPSVFEFFCKKHVGLKISTFYLEGSAYTCEHVVLPTSEIHHQLQHLLTTNLTSRDWRTKIGPNNSLFVLVNRRFSFCWARSKITPTS